MKTTLTQRIQVEGFKIDKFNEEVGDKIAYITYNGLEVYDLEVTTYIVDSETMEINRTIKSTFEGYTVGCGMVKAGTPPVPTAIDFDYSTGRATIYFNVEQELNF